MDGGEYIWTKEREANAKKLAFQKGDKLIADGEMVVLDNTNLRESGILPYITSWQKHGQKHVIFFVRMKETDPKICHARCTHNVELSMINAFAESAKAIEEKGFPSVSSVLLKSMMQEINSTLTASMKRNIALDFHPYLVIDEVNKLKVVEDVQTNIKVIMETTDLAEDKTNGFEYLVNLMKAGFKVEESLQFFPIREGAGDDENGHWQLPVNIEENEVLKNRNLLCVTWLANV